MRLKSAAILFVFVAVAVVMLWRIWQIQDTYGEEYHRRAMAQLISNRHGESVITPNRGAIMDRNGNVLAASSIEFNIFIDVRRLVRTDHSVQAASVEKIHQVLGIPTEQLWGYLELEDEENRVAVIDREYHVIARRVSYEVGRELEGLNPRHVHLEYDSRRVYRHDNLASSVLGFVRNDYRWGLERQYNIRLTGVPGRMFHTLDSDRNVAMERVDAVEGQTIITTLDSYLQGVGEGLAQQFGAGFGAEGAGIIVMDPFTGEILVMAQYPTFNLNDPTNIDYINSERIIQQLEPLSHAEQINQLHGVWQNTNIGRPLEIGSVYKSFTVAKALEEGIVTPDWRFFCNGFTYVGVTRIHCHSHWRGGCGDQNLSQTLANSCNPAMVELSALMGREIFHQYQVDFGYGDRTGIDLPAEASGLIFSLPRLNATELATSSFGQRFMATPLQTAVSFSALINGGYVVQPFIVSQIVDERGFVIHENRPNVVRSVISQETSDWMRVEQQLAITDGTGRRAAIPGHTIGGKTGTGAQGTEGTDDWGGWSRTFAGYFPVDNPRYLIVTVVDRMPDETLPGRDSSAVDMFREMAEAIIDHMSIPPANGTTGANGVIVEIMLACQRNKQLSAL